MSYDLLDPKKDWGIVARDLKLIECLLPWQRRGLRETASGYGRKLTTEYKVRYNGRLYRVYCCCFSNSGTRYIVAGGRELVLS